MFYVHYCNSHWAFNCNWLYMYTYDEHVYFDSLLSCELILVSMYWCCLMSHSVTHLSLYVILVSKLFLCPSCSHTQPTENTTAYTCLKCLFYMHSLTVHNCINVSMFLSSLFFVVCVICVVRSVVPVPVDRHLRRVVSLHPGVADSNDIHHNTSATPTLRTVLTVTGTARRTSNRYFWHYSFSCTHTRNRLHCSCIFSARTLSILV